MCCGKKQQPPISVRIMQMNNDYTSSLNYLGTDINTTWQAPSKRSYIVSSDNRTFAVHPDDVAWFLTRMARGNPLFAIVPEPVIEPVAIEPIEELPFAIIEELATEPLEIQETQEKKRTRKSKATETQDSLME